MSNIKVSSNKLLFLSLGFGYLCSMEIVNGFSGFIIKFKDNKKTKKKGKTEKNQKEKLNMPNFRNYS